MLVIDPEMWYGVRKQGAEARFRCLGLIHMSNRIQGGVWYNTRKSDLPHSEPTRMTKIDEIRTPMRPS